MYAVCMYISLYTHMYMYVYIYIYIYTHVDTCAIYMVVLERLS